MISLHDQLLRCVHSGDTQLCDLLLMRKADITARDSEVSHGCATAAPRLRHGCATAAQRLCHGRARAAPELS